MLPGLGLVVVVGVRLLGSRGSDAFQFGPNPLKFLIKRVTLLLMLEGRGTPFGQFGLQPLQFSPRDNLRAVDRLGDEVIPPRPGLVGGLWGVGPRHPVADVVQFLDHLKGVVLPHRAIVVNGLVALLLDHPRLLKDRRRYCVLKTWLVK